jgi:uncharacterized protein with FMN-binding domain
MKKLALSFVVIVASGAYVWQQWSSAPTVNPLDSTILTGSTGDSIPGVLPAAPGSPPTAPSAESALGSSVPGLELQSHPIVMHLNARNVQMIESSARQAVPTRAVLMLTAGNAYSDGTFTGPVTDAYWGPMQIQAVIQNGQLVNIGVIQWPNDRRTSVRINQEAIPLLRDEVVQAQSANVDIISGATLTSQAFIQSIAGALRQAGAH